MDSFAPNKAEAELKAMQDSIYREKILQTRRQTPEERLAKVHDAGRFTDQPPASLS